MLISKFDLYKPEWLELVFTKRNKEYGAFYLRWHSAENTAKAMGITFFSVISLLVGFGFVIRSKPAELFRNTEVVLQKVIQPPPAQPKKEETHQAKAAPPKTLVATTRFVPPVVVPQETPIEPPKINEMKGEIGPVDIDIPEGTGGVPNIDAGTGNGSTASTSNGTEVYDKGGVDVEPEPVGGAAAWAKFLQKNLRYPGQALDQQKSGKVWVSFIVEKNGHISTLVVEKGVGYGMDDEALRVLKLALPWKPGLQHGQPVRVKYTLPLNFVLNN